jgi:hypothetical protein
LAGTTAGYLIKTRQASPLAACFQRIWTKNRCSGGCADFLWAWWNARSCGSFDLATLWSVDSDTGADMVTVFALIARIHNYPDSLGYEADFKAIVHAWRPELSG